MIPQDKTVHCNCKPTLKKNALYFSLSYHIRPCTQVNWDFKGDSELQISNVLCGYKQIVQRTEVLKNGERRPVPNTA